MNGTQADDCIAIVPIRAGSKGLANKNIKLFAGTPLYEHAVQQGLRCCSACVVSTDITSVLEAPIADGRILHSRTAELSSDSAPMDGVLRDVIETQQLSGTTIVLLQATSPLRQDHIIRQAIAQYRTGYHELVLTVTRAERSILKWGTVEDCRFTPVNDPALCFANRQSLPEVFRPNGAVYVFSSDWFLANGGLATDSIGAVIMPAEQSLDIDSEEDFRLAQDMFETQPPKD